MKRLMTAAVLAVTLCAGGAFAQGAEESDGPHAEMGRGRGKGGGFGMGRGGIPPHVAERLGISKEVQQRVQALAFEANEQLIGLDADLKRARLELQKQLTVDRPDQRAVMALVDKIAKAEAEVRKNRLGLMLKVRELVGPEAWKKLQSEWEQRKRGRKGGRPGAQQG